MPNVACPNCNSANTCRIVYGMPVYTPELEQKLAAGKVHLGGCVIELDSPNRYCNDCELDFDTNAPNIYLDIDGVLLANDLTPANYAKEFLAIVLERHPHTTYWLTTHCDGDASVPIQHIGHLFDNETVELMKKSSQPAGKRLKPVPLILVNHSYGSMTTCFMKKKKRSKSMARSTTGLRLILPKTPINWLNSSLAFQYR